MAWSSDVSWPSGASLPRMISAADCCWLILLTASPRLQIRFQVLPIEPKIFFCRLCMSNDLFLVSWDVCTPHIVSTYSDFSMLSGPGSRTFVLLPVHRINHTTHWWLELCCFHISEDVKHNRPWRQCRWFPMKQYRWKKSRALRQSVNCLITYTVAQKLLSHPQGILILIPGLVFASPAFSRHSHQSNLVNYSFMRRLDTREIVSPIKVKNVMWRFEFR